MSAKEVERLRMKLGLSQAELAEALGLAGRGVVYRWESGARAPNEALRRLFCYLDDLSEDEARTVVEKLSTYGKKKIRKKT